MSLLSQVNSPSDLKKLSIKELEQYAAEVRQYIISTVNSCGGHLASNLGSVEFTIALHYVFDSPEDKILFDTGHQSYTHKIITGRNEEFSSLRSRDGVSGFQNKSESEHDPYTSGHSGNAISVGLGLSRALKNNGAKSKVISVIGDGALTAGMSYEAINDVGANGDDMIIVLNDNKMSISPNVGAVSKYLLRLRTSIKYSVAKEVIRKGILAIPFVGEKLLHFARKIKRSLKKMVSGDVMFEHFGVKYYGPFDGHNIKDLIAVFNAVKNKNKPILVHLLTEKGHGYKYAEENPEKYHGVSAGNGSANNSFSAVFGEKLCSLAENNEKIVAVTAAMSDGTGLASFADKFPDRFFDVGIAEAHAVSLSAGLFIGGMRPFFAVYSSFLQRGFDQALIDVGIDNLPVTFMIDHAGFVSGDGVTHQGLYDLAMLSLIPSITIMTPINGEHLKKMMDLSLNLSSPVAIRYPKSYNATAEKFDEDLTYGKWNQLKSSSSKNLIVVASSRLINLALSIEDATVVFASFIKPFDKQYLIENQYDKILVLEDNITIGGLGESVSNLIKEINPATGVYILGGTYGYVHSYSAEEYDQSVGLTKENINKIINTPKNN